MARLLALTPPNPPRLADNAPDPGVIARRLLKWYRKYGRSFSWRTSNDPYYVLMAEVLLRKTGARAVEAQIGQIVQALPTAAALATARENDIRDTLLVLGLSVQRAQQLKRLGEVLIEQFGGRVPRDVEALVTLPGVGHYTAGIVASTATNARVPAVDGSIARLLCRVFGIVPSHLEPRKSTNVWQIAAVLMLSSGHRPVRLTWAEMDLATSVCTSRDPHHDLCPLRSTCLYVRKA